MAKRRTKSAGRGAGAVKSMAQEYGELEAEWNMRQGVAEEQARLMRKRAMEIETTMAAPQDRMMRYRREHDCPECHARPVVCRIKRGSYAAYRCRVCGHLWETGERIAG